MDDLNVDLAIIGAGAAGLAAAIFAGREARGRNLRIVLIEGAKKPGAKILVSGGGRCNVTNEHVDEDDFWGGSRAIIRNVIRQFDNHQTRRWFENMGVTLKLEPTGKYFPTTDRAQTVLEALLKAVGDVGVELWTGARLTQIETVGNSFHLKIVRASSGAPSPSQIFATRVVVATGGLALPKSGSDGAGISMMRKLGHTIVPTTPALAGLVLQKSRTLAGRFAEFAGMSFAACITMWDKRHKRAVLSLDGDVLFTHFGVSGPVAMNMSRHWERARLEGRETDFVFRLMPKGVVGIEQATQLIRSLRSRFATRRVSDLLETLYPSRYAEAIARESGEDVQVSQLTKELEARVCQLVGAMELPIIGTRGYTHAEATAGGVDLNEVNWRTMESRVVPDLYLCGEILDVDGKIGGYSFQWAWSSGYVAGRGVMKGL